MQYGCVFYTHMLYITGVRSHPASPAPSGHSASYHPEQNGVLRPNQLSQEGKSGYRLGENSMDSTQTAEDTWMQLNVGGTTYITKRETLQQVV